MNYRCTIEINAPINRVIDLWEDEANFKHWQDGFESITHLSGIPHTPGATANILINGRQKMELKETIITNNLPQEKMALYEHIHMTNTQTTRFEKTGESSTLYISEVEYTQFNGFMIKLMAKLFPGMFKKQSKKWMEQFKVFVEQQ